MPGNPGSRSWSENIEEQREYFNLARPEEFGSPYERSGLAKAEFELEQTKELMAGLTKYGDGQPISLTSSNQRSYLEELTPYTRPYTPNEGNELNVQDAFAKVVKRAPIDLNPLLDVVQAIEWAPKFRRGKCDNNLRKPDKLMLTRDGGVFKGNDYREEFDGDTIGAMQKYAHYDSLREALMANLSRPRGVWSGIGVDLRGEGPGIFVVDIDGCLDAREVEPRDRQILDNAAGRMAQRLIIAGAVPWYSASGTGLHFWFTIPDDGVQLPQYSEAYRMGVEVFYPQLLRSDRFVAMSLQPYSNIPPEILPLFTFDPAAVGLPFLLEDWMDAEDFSRNLINTHGVDVNGESASDEGGIASSNSPAIIKAASEGRTIFDEQDGFPIAETRGRLSDVIKESKGEYRSINRLALRYPELWFEDCAAEMGLEVTHRGPINWRAGDSIYEESLSLLKRTKFNAGGIVDFRLADSGEVKEGRRSAIDLVIDMLYLAEMREKVSGFGDPEPSFPWGGLAAQKRLKSQTTACVSDENEASDEEETSDAQKYPLFYKEEELRKKACNWLGEKLRDRIQTGAPPAATQAFAADVFSRYARDDFMFDRNVGNSGRWRCFNGAVWSDDEAFNDRAKEKMRDICMAFTRTFTTTKGGPSVVSTSNSFQTNALHQAAFNLSLSLPPGEVFDAPETQHLIGVNSLSKVWNTKTGEFEPPGRRDYLTFTMTGDVAFIEKEGNLYPDQNAKCDALKEYFDHQFEDYGNPDLGEEMMEEFITMAAQHALGGNKAKQIHILIGETNTGKGMLSTLIKRALGPGMCGDMNKSAVYTDRHDKPLAEQMPLAQFRSVHIEELDNSRRLKADDFKTFTNDEMALRGMRENLRTHVVQATPIILTNSFPKLTDDAGGAVSSRMRVLRLDKNITKRQDVTDRIFEQLPALRAKVLIRAAEISGQYSLREHPQMAAFKQTLLGDLNPVRSFMEDKDFVEIDYNSTEYLRDLYQLYRVWNGWENTRRSDILSKAKFTAQLKKLCDENDSPFGYEPKVLADRTAGILGIRLVSEPTRKDLIDARYATGGFQVIDGSSQTNDDSSDSSDTA